MLNDFDVFKDETLNCYQIRTKSHGYVVEFDDTESEQIFLNIASIISNDPTISYINLKSKLHGEEGKVLNVLSLLREYELIPDQGTRISNAQQIDDAYQGDANLSGIEVCLFGDGLLINKIEKLLNRDDLTFRLVKIDNNSDVNLEELISQTNFSIVDATHWSPYIIEQVNQLSLKHNKPWLYIGGVDELSLKLGPLFYGDHTGCYNCLFSRVLSNHEYPEYLLSYRKHLIDSFTSSKTDIIPEQELYLNILANYSVLEIKKFFTGWSLPNTWRSLVKIDIYDFNVSRHKLLKKPFCEICRPVLKYNPAPWLEAVTLK